MQAEAACTRVDLALVKQPALMKCPRDWEEGEEGEEVGVWMRANFIF